MITKVKLKHWKSHKDSELEFTAGTNGLVGIVGSGKTSILDAICFVLFGTFPTLQTRKIKLEDIIMKKPTVENSAEAEVHFSINGNQYSVRRIIEKDRGTSYSEIKENGKIMESPSTKNVTSCVEKVLKVNYELFSKAIYSEQNSIDYFLNLGKGQRMKKIDELLMIDKFEQARANAVSLTNKLVNVKIGKQSTIDSLDPEEIRKSIKEIKDSIKELEQSSSALKTELKDIVKRRTELEHESEELANIKEQFEMLQRDKSSIESAIKETSEMLASLEDILKDVETTDISSKLDEYSKKIDDMDSVLLDKQGKYNDLQKQMADSMAKVELLKGEKISRLEDELEEKLKLKKEFEHLRDTTGENIEQQLNEKRSLLEKLIGDIESSRSKIVEMDEILEKLSSVGSRCPICDSPLSEERKNILLTERRRDLKKLEKRLEDAINRREVEEQHIERLQSAMKKLEEMFKEIKDLDAVRTELENSRQAFAHHSKIVENVGSELESIRAEISRVQKEIAAATTDKQKMEIVSGQMNDYKSRKERLKGLEEKRKQVDKSISEIKSRIGERELKKTEEWLRNIIAKEKEVETNISNFDSLAKERMQRLKEYEKSLEVSEKEKENVERIGRMIKELKIFTQALTQTQIELRKEFIEAVNYTMNRLWPTLYPYQDFIGVRLAVEKGDYVLQLQERTTNWINVEGVVSGGERSIACLALRIAFALVLAPHLRMLVLDEPTANLDSNSIKVLSNTLRESIGEFIDQCFIITHDEVFEESVTGNAYRMERDKGKNESTRVIQIS